MSFTMAITAFTAIALLTLANEYRRSGGLTLLSILSLGNVAYNAVSPVVYYYSPSSANIYAQYLSDAGLVIQADGLVRVVLAAAIFQLVCLGTSLWGGQKKNLMRADALSSKSFIKASTQVGWALVIAGMTGGIWLGVIYNGSLWGIYEISYAERSPLFHGNSAPAFLLLLGMFGAAQLIVVYLLTGRPTAAALILLLVTAHAMGIKSKFPLFWTLVVFLFTVIGSKKIVPQLFFPIGFPMAILLAMSALRGIENFADIPQYLTTYWDSIGKTAFAPWNNDIPGPASITYYVINTVEEYTSAPLKEILLLLIPRFVFDRGMVLSNVYAQKMMGGEYETGLGFGWSLLCDGFLLGGWLGIALIALILALLARFLYDMQNSAGEKKELFMIMCYSCAPLFLYGVRESVGGFMKYLLVMAIVIWLPTYYLYQKERRAQEGRQESSPASMPTAYCAGEQVTGNVEHDHV